jgi:hypothetical protein
MRHQAVYYNVAFRRLMWLNGIALDQMEFLVAMRYNVPIGIEGTGHPIPIVFRLHLIPETPLDGH